MTSGLGQWKGGAPANIIPKYQGDPGAAKRN